MDEKPNIDRQEKKCEFKAIDKEFEFEKKIIMLKIVTKLKL
jgi:hypothetical protein